MGTLNHRKVTTLPDNPASDISSDEWNDSIVLRGADLTGAVLARDTGAADGWSAIASAAGVLTCAAPGSLATFRPLAGTDLPANLALTSSLAIGASPAITGALRLGNNQSISASNAAHNADIALMTLSAANGVKFATGDDWTFINSAGTTVATLNPAGTFYPQADNSADLGGVAPFRWRSGYFGTSLSIGTLPAQSGAIRLANGAAITARDQANGIDLTLINTDASNIVRVGDPAKVAILRGTGVQFISGSDANFYASNYTFSNGSGATVFWALATTFIPGGHNTQDIGINAQRPRTIFVGTSIVTAGFNEFAEMTTPAAPVTDRVRFYAEDNGSGKTRLMARFATGAAVQLAIEP